MSPSHILNEWTKIASVCLPDEPIRAVIHFHNGKKVNFLTNFKLTQSLAPTSLQVVANIQNRDSTSYLDRYPQVDMKCTLRGFGGRPVEGFIAVGASGLIQGAIVENGKVLTTNVDVLGGFRLAYKFVDLALTKGIEISSLALELYANISLSQMVIFWLLHRRVCQWIPSFTASFVF